MKILTKVFFTLTLALVTIPAFSFIAHAATPVITSSVTATGQVGVPFTYQVTATESPNRFSASVGLAAAGLSINPTTGLVAGTPTTSGVFNIIILAGNSEGNSPGTWFLTLTVTGTSVNVEDLPPTTPTNLKVESTGLFYIDLSWTASTDDKGVGGYKVFRDNIEIGGVDSGVASPLSYRDNSRLEPNIIYSYSVLAFDTAGNQSGRSNTVTARAKLASEITAGPEIVSFFHNNSNGINATIISGQATNLIWKVTGLPTPTVSIDNGIGTVLAQSSNSSQPTISVSPSTTTTYTLTATNSVGTVTSSLTVVVAPSWTLVSSSAPVSRQGMSALVFNNKMWIMGAGGSTNLNSGISNDVWSSEDGVNWIKVREDNSTVTQGAMWTQRYSPASVVFNNKMWIIGGQGRGGSLNDVWSSEDGVNWTLVTTNAAWAPRYVHSAVVFNNKMWVMGGLVSSSNNQDVWSSEDGVNWTLVTSSPGWLAANAFTTLVFNNKMWVIGSTISSLSAPFNDSNFKATEVWSSSDGISWNQVTKNVGFLSQNFSSYGAVVYNNKIWIFAGSETTDRPDGSNEVLSSSDGVTWQREIIKGGWKKINLFASFVHSGTIWVLGGTGSQDVWKLTSNNPSITAPSFAIAPSTVVPNGSVQPDGLVILDHGTIFVIEHGQKRPFPSMEVFHRQGFSLNNMVKADISTIPEGVPISAQERHTRGTIVVHEGTVYFLGKDVRYPFPSLEVFRSWGHSFKHILPANEFDLKLPIGPVVQQKQ